MVFQRAYADVYDPLYRDKDYEQECDILEETFRRHGCRPGSVLDLGCGTGGHALVLAKRGYEVTGVDRSSHMLDIARRKARGAGANVEFIEGDVAAVRLERKFDAVISMFAVMGYLVTNNAVAGVCRKVKVALKPGGLFVFDCWQGPAVIAERPGRRVKEASISGGGTVTRTAEPELDMKNHIVKVHFTVRRDDAGRLTEDRETHIMRYFFAEELRTLLSGVGFAEIRLYPFPDIGRALSEKDWNMLVVGR